MTEIQQNRWDQLVRRVSGIVGGGSQVNDTLNELFPFLDVETNKGELQALAGTGIAWGRILAGPTVGENSRGQLFNPVGSSKIITVTTVSIRGAAADNFELGTLEVALASLSAVARFRDTRFGSVLVPVAQLRTDTNVGATPATFSVAAGTSPSLLLTDANDIAVLTPGFGLVVSASTANVGIRVGFVWRERVAEPSELNL